MSHVRLLVCALFVGAVALAAAVSAEDKPAEEGFVPLFNGKDLTGWEGDAKLWTVKDGVLVGKSEGIKYNDFLATTKEYGNFVLRFQVKLVDNKGNSGMQFRSKRVPNSHEVSGYQADIADGWWAKLYDEARRNRVLAEPKPEDLKKALKVGDWNEYEVEAVGDHITMTLNGVKMVEYTEADKDVARSGVFATQIHAGEPMEVQFKNIRIKEVKQN